MTLSQYVNTNYNKLSSDEIINLFEDRSTNKEIIIKSQLPMVLKVAHSFTQSTGNDIKELFSEALAILNNCVDNFDTTRGFTFYSYYVPAIKNRLNDYNDNGIRIPTNRLKDKPSTTTPFSWMEDDEQTFDNSDKLSTEQVNAEHLEDELYNPTKQIAIIQRYAKPKQADIIIRYIGLTGDTMTFADIGKEYNSTGEGIRQQYNKGIESIKNNWKR